MKKTLLVSTAVLAIISMAVISSSNAMAHGFYGEGYSTIVQKLVDKFNLNQGEVEAVFDEAKKEHQTQMRANFETKLSQAISDGKITETQKQAILTKHDELAKNHEQIWQNKENMTKEQIMELKSKQREELKTWAEQNGIDLKYFWGFGKMGLRGWHKGI